jgi:hypothetical protein
MSTPIPDFTTADLQQVEALLRQRYGSDVPVEPAECELGLDPSGTELTTCPTLYWTAQGAHFVVFRLAADRYGCQFFYADADHYGTGRDDYAELAHCVRTLLQVQADHARESAAASSRAGALADAGDPLGPPLL